MNKTQRGLLKGTDTTILDNVGGYLLLKEHAVNGYRIMDPVGGCIFNTDSKFAANAAWDILKNHGERGIQ
jgi:hypothetical protein